MFDRVDFFLHITPVSRRADCERFFWKKCLIFENWSVRKLKQSLLNKTLKSLEVKGL